MESDSTALATGCLFEGCYEIFGDLGTGSFGRVYRARQLSTGQIVTIKPLSPRAGADESMERALGRLRREIATGADLSHPNIVGLIDSSETADRQPRSSRSSKARRWSRRWPGRRRSVLPRPSG